MIIDFQNFTPFESLLGGILLGISSAIFILVNGRILGISGILGGLLHPRKGDITWRIMFLLGMTSAPFVFRFLFPVSWIVEPKIEANYLTSMIAGILVGFGTRYGSGCTSGHGVCGLSRLSLRSMVSTITFMLFGFLSVYVVRHLFQGYS